MNKGNLFGELISKIKEITFLRYFIFGGIAALIELAGFYILTNNLAVPYIFATPISFSVSATVNYFLQRRFTFKNKYSQKHWQFSAFFIIALGGLLINWVTTVFYVEFLSISPIYSKIGAILTVFLFNYFLNKKITFGKMK